MTKGYFESCKRHKHVLGSARAYVSPEKAAAFLNTNRLKVIRMARAGALPVHPFSTGRRRQWRFKLSELDKHMQHGIDIARPPVRQGKEHQ